MPSEIERTKRLEPAYFTGGILKEPLETWKIELVKLVEKAHTEGKWLRSLYQGITFTPMGLAGCLIEGRFVWGIVNWELIEPRKEADYGDDYYEQVLKNIQP